MTALVWPVAEEHGAGSESTRQRLLELLKRGGPQTVQTLAELLGVTAPAARRHLLLLQEQGLIAARVEKPGGRGRPQHVFALTNHGEERAFPRSYAALCNDVLEHLSVLHGRGSILTVFDARNIKLAQQWQMTLNHAATLEERLHELARFLNEQGFEASVEQRGGRWYLTERNCPHLQVARVFRELCASEMQLYASVLGVRLIRDQYILAGQGCCRYQVVDEAPHE